MKIQRDAIAAIQNAALLTAADVVHQRVWCPACMVKVFEMWPEGWDGHAASRCSPLVGSTPDERKAEYKRVFAHHFR